MEGGGGICIQVVDGLYTSKMVVVGASHYFPFPGIELVY